MFGEMELSALSTKRTPRPAPLSPADEGSARGDVHSRLATDTDCHCTPVRKFGVGICCALSISLDYYR
jgi:hypothetical protein